VAVAIEQTTNLLASGGADDSASAPGSKHRPSRWVVDVSVSCHWPVEFTLKLRMPWWTTQPATVVLNGEAVPGENAPSSFFAISRKWHNDTIRLELPVSLTVSEIPDEPETVAFLDGPVVLAGLCREKRVLTGDRSDPSSFLIPDNESEPGRPWPSGYRTMGQQLGLRFRPLCEIADEPYTLYFPIQPSGRD